MTVETAISASSDSSEDKSIDIDPITLEPLGSMTVRMILYNLYPVNV
jgi:hypothetical protein